MTAVVINEVSLFCVKINNIKTCVFIAVVWGVLRIYW